MDELRSALELASDDELQQLTDILFCRRFNPIDYLQTPEPIDIKSRDRCAWLDAVEQRFRYLAADGITVLRGSTQQITYRQALIKICRYLKIPFANNLSTTDLEAEIFLFLMGQAWKKLPASEQKMLTIRVQKALVKTNFSEPLPLSVQKNPFSLFFKGGSALAVSSVIQPLLLRQLARQFAIQFAQYQLAKETLALGGSVAAAGLENYVALQTAKQGMTLAATRYGAVRTMLSFVGPVLWTWFLADLGWRSIATNYARIIPTVFALAQIRLTRAECWDYA